MSNTVDRPFWRSQVEKCWKEAPIVWLAGVRRVGKTTLAQSLGGANVKFLNCDLPVVADMVKNPGLFYRGVDQPIVVFDEVHQLPDPTRLLKIAADEFRHLKILATGSSTLFAGSKFRDTLTGRKRNLHLLPVLWDELGAFGGVSLQKRLFQGGLPPALLATEKSPSFYREWADSFFARDIQHLFAFRDVHKFQAVLEYVMKQSGGLIEITRTATALGITRPTAESHLRALEITKALTLVRPFHGGGQKEIVKMPKAYGFDTGFVSFFRGWHPLRAEDYGVLWEHLVLEYLTAHSPNDTIQFWRDKTQREIDFVMALGRDQVDVIECKWNVDQFEADALKVFRSYYPKGTNYLVCPINVDSYKKRFGSHEVVVCNPDGWRKHARTVGQGATS